MDAHGKLMADAVDGPAKHGRYGRRADGIWMLTANRWPMRLMARETDVQYSRQFDMNAHGKPTADGPTPTGYGGSQQTDGRYQYFDQGLLLDS